MQSCHPAASGVPSAVPGSCPSLLRLAAPVLLLFLALSACGGATRKSAPPPSSDHSASDHSASGPLDPQPPPGDARRRLRRAIAAIDAGRLSEAVPALVELHAQFPRNGVILHELALAYRLGHEPRKAVELLGPFRSWLQAESLASYGSALDESGDRMHAEAVLREGIARFPGSGLLYSELGTLIANRGQPELAIETYERGISADPHTPANYFNAAQLLAKGPHRGLAIVYGEVFRLLEPDSPRSERTAGLLLGLCRSAVRFEARGQETRAVVSLAPNVVEVDERTDLTALPFESAFEVLFGSALVVVHGRGLSLESLHEARKMFIEHLRQPNAPTKLLAHPLMRWLMALEEAGHLPAYDAWLFGPGAPDEFKAWLHRAETRTQLHAMARYVVAHPIFPKADQNNPDTI